MSRFVKNCCLYAFMVGHTSHTYPYEKSHLLDAFQSTNSGIDRGSDFHLKSLQRNTSALDQLGKALDPLLGNWLLGEIIPHYTPCFIRQQYLNVVVPIHTSLTINERVCQKLLQRMPICAILTQMLEL